MKQFILTPVLFLALAAAPQHKVNDIVGRWMSSESNLEVEVYKTGNEYRAKVIWFDDTDNKSKPYNIRLDTKNPDKAMRTKKICGMEVMHGLIYNADDDEWQYGRIYDASSGKDWNAKAWLAKDGNLKVRGYWHFEFLGQIMTFRKI